MEREAIEVPLKIEMEQRPSEGYKREPGWWSRVVIAHLLSEWQGPFESQKKAAAFWQNKLIRLTE